MHHVLGDGDVASIKPQAQQALAAIHDVIGRSPLDGNGNPFPLLHMGG